MNLLHANDRPGAHPPSWYAETAEAPGPYAELKGTHRADVAVVGGGFTGLSAALSLARAGASVALVEAQRVGFGASGRNGGQVGFGLRVAQRALEREAGEDAARALWDLAVAAKDKVRALVRDHAPDAGWRPGIVHAERRAADALAREAEHLARRYGHETELLDGEALRALIGSDRYEAGALDPGAGHVHPLRLAFGMARAAGAAGAAIFERSEAHRVSPGLVLTGRGRIECEAVILACNGYLGTLDGHVAARVMPINSFVVATEPLGGRMPLARPVAVHDGAFVVSYWRPSEDGRILFGGGESYGYRFPRDIAALVRPTLEAVYPRLRGVPITHAWGGTLAITRTRMPLFARPAPGVLSASGYSGHGVALACLAGKILAEAARGPSERFDAFASLAPPPFPGGGAFRTPLLALAMTWYAMRDRLGR